MKPHECPGAVRVTVPSHTRCPPPKRVKVQRVDDEGRNVGPARDYHAPHPRARAKPHGPRQRVSFHDLPVGEASTEEAAEMPPPRGMRRHGRTTEVSREERAAAAIRYVAPELREMGIQEENVPPHLRRRADEILHRRVVGVRGLDGSPIDVHGKRKVTKENRRRIARLVMKRLVDVKGPAPRYEDIDPWAVDFLPCTGQTYEQFRSGFTRSEAYWHRAAGKEHGPSKRKVNTEHAQTKRAVWHKALYDCALAFWKYKNGIPLDAGEVDPTEFLDGLSGVSRKGKAMKKPAKKSKKQRCKDAPKKVSRGCSEAAFKKNMRHLVCQGKRPQQAAAIAYALVYKGCGVKQTKRKRKVASIVASGKRKRARR